MRHLKYLLVLLVLPIALDAIAQVPRTISYQGVLQESSGKPVADGAHTLTLTLYATRTGQVALHTQTATVTTKGGVFQVMLDGIPSALAFNDALYLGISVNGGTELSPRTLLTAAPYALNVPDTLIREIRAKDATLTVDNGRGPVVRISIPTDAISTSKIQNGAVTNEKIASVSWSKITGKPTSEVSGPAGGDLAGNYPDPVLTATGVTAGVYTNPSITVDTKGRIISAASGASGNFALPYTGGANSTNVFDIHNTSPANNGTAIRGTINTISTLDQPGGAAILGVNNNPSIVARVWGVAGSVASNSGFAAGVYGFNGSPDGGSGVLGRGYFGISGVAASMAGGYAVYGSANGAAYAGYFNGGQGIYTVGNQTATGAKAAIVPVGNDWRKLYCEEATEIYFSDYGSAQLVNGSAFVPYDEMFLQTVTIDAVNAPKIFIQLHEESEGVFVRKEEGGFRVIENRGGRSNGTFDYRIQAKRKGYENVRLERAEGPR